MNAALERPDPMPEKWAEAWDQAEPGSIEQYLIFHAVSSERDNATVETIPVEKFMDRFERRELALIRADEHAAEMASEGDFARGL